MAVRIRLSRIGRQNRPFYRIAVFDSRTRRDGRILEQIGHYDPIHSLSQDKEKSPWTLDLDRLRHWLSKGAKVTGVIASYLRTQKFVFENPAKKRAVNKAHATARKAARRRTGRTVEKSAQANGRKG